MQFGVNVNTRWPVIFPGETAGRRGGGGGGGVEHKRHETSGPATLTRALSLPRREREDHKKGADRKGIIRGSGSDAIRREREYAVAGDLPGGDGGGGGGGLRRGPGGGGGVQLRRG